MGKVLFLSRTKYKREKSKAFGGQRKAFNQSINKSKPTLCTQVNHWCLVVAPLSFYTLSYNC